VNISPNTAFCSIDGSWYDLLLLQRCEVICWKIKQEYEAFGTQLAQKGCQYEVMAKSHYDWIRADIPCYILLDSTSTNLGPEFWGFSYRYSFGF